MCDVIVLDAIRNKYTSKSLGLTDITEKLERHTLKHFGHVEKK